MAVDACGVATVRVPDMLGVCSSQQTPQTCRLTGSQGSGPGLLPEECGVSFSIRKGTKSGSITWKGEQRTFPVRPQADAVSVLSQRDLKASALGRSTVLDVLLTGGICWGADRSLGDPVRPRNQQSGRPGAPPPLERQNI